MHWQHLAVIVKKYHNKFECINLLARSTHDEETSFCANTLQDQLFTYPMYNEISRILYDKLQNYP